MACAPLRSSSQARVLCLVSDEGEPREYEVALRRAEALPQREVAAAKVRRAQSAVLQSRPFSETLASLIVNLRSRLRFADVDNKFLEERKIKNVALLVVSGERGLCGAYN